VVLSSNEIDEGYYFITRGTESTCSDLLTEQATVVTSLDS
ncbi:unnamed protein product, partial [Acidithrix sp. C25]